MESCVSRQKVLILDCCYSGAFPAGRLAKGDTEVHALERFHGRGRTVLTASDATQYSFEGDRAHGDGHAVGVHPPSRRRPARRQRRPRRRR